MKRCRAYMRCTCLGLLCFLSCVCAGGSETLTQMNVPSLVRFDEVDHLCDTTDTSPERVKIKLQFPLNECFQLRDVPGHKRFQLDEGSGRVVLCFGQCAENVISVCEKTFDPVCNASLNAAPQQQIANLSAEIFDTTQQFLLPIATWQYSLASCLLTVAVFFLDFYLTYTSFPLETGRGPDHKLIVQPSDTGGLLNKLVKRLPRPTFSRQMRLFINMKNLILLFSMLLTAVPPMVIGIAGIGDTELLLFDRHTGERHTVFSTNITIFMFNTASWCLTVADSGLSIMANFILEGTPTQEGDCCCLCCDDSEDDSQQQKGAGSGSGSVVVVTHAKAAAGSDTQDEHKAEQEARKPKQLEFESGLFGGFIFMMFSAFFCLVWAVSTLEFTVTPSGVFSLNDYIEEWYEIFLPTMAWLWVLLPSCLVALFAYAFLYMHAKITLALDDWENAHMTISELKSLWVRFKLSTLLFTLMRCTSLTCACYAVWHLTDDTGLNIEAEQVAQATAFLSMFSKLG